MASVQDSIAKQATHMALSQVISLCTRVSGSPQGYLAGAFFDNRTAFSFIIEAPLGQQGSSSSLASVVKTFNT